MAACLTLLLAPLIVTPADAYDPTTGWPTPWGWTEYGGSTDRSGRSPAHGPGTHSDAAAPHRFAAQSFSAPVVDWAGHVYIGDTSGRVHKLTPDLEPVWRSAPLGGEIRSSVLVGPDGTVYVAPVGPSLVALSGSDGKVRWRATIDNEATAGSYVVSGAPAYHPDGFIVQGSMDGHVYAIDEDGARRWRFQTHSQLDNKVVAAAAIDDAGRILIGSQNGRIYALDAQGRSLAHYHTRELTSAQAPEEQQVAAPTLDGAGGVYVTTRLKDGSSGKVYALTFDGATFQKRWSRQLDEKITAPVAIGASGGLYVGTLAGTFYRLDAADGDIVWDFYAPRDDPSPAFTTALAGGTGRILAIAELAVTDAAGRVYFPYWVVDVSQGFPPEDSLESPFYALDAATGAIEWRRDFDKTVRSPAMMPLVAQEAGRHRGALHLSGDDGRAYVIADGAPEPRTLARPAPPPPPAPSAAPSDDPVGNAPADGTAADTPAPAAALVVLALLALTHLARPTTVRPRRDRP